MVAGSRVGTMNRGFLLEGAPVLREFGGNSSPLHRHLPQQARPPKQSQVTIQHLSQEIP